MNALRTIAFYVTLLGAVVLLVTRDDDAAKPPDEPITDETFFRVANAAYDDLQEDPAQPEPPWNPDPCTFTNDIERCGRSADSLIHHHLCKKENICYRLYEHPRMTCHPFQSAHA